MQKNSYTPGPWTVVAPFIDGPADANVSNGDRNSVAQAFGPDSDANCQLIAAAPDLAAALADALESLKRLPDVDGAYRVSCIFQAESALRKAGVL